MDNCLDEKQLAASDAVPFWTKMAPASIPSKPALHDAFLAVIDCVPAGGRLLDLGCGDGSLTAKIAESYPCLYLVGVDVNADAIKAACGLALAANMDQLTFQVGNVTELQYPPKVSFNLVLAQLVLSVVGGPEQRKKFLREARSRLIAGGHFLLSASGASDDINAEYQRLYKMDEPVTGEFRTYFSRAADGSILYPTHHFTEEELRYLLESEGFHVEKLLHEREASSRRPDQAAWFFYVVARVGEDREDINPSKRPRVTAE